MIETCPFNIPTRKNVCTVEAVAYFVWEREAIRIARENGHAAPWTTDPVLAKYKFTNIRRKDDRVSQWVIEKLITPNLGRKDLWFTLLIARLLNWPPTLKMLKMGGVIPCKPKEFRSAMFVSTIENLKEEIGKVYSGAYMVYPTKMDPGGKKSEALAKHIIGSAITSEAEITASLKENSIEKFVTSLSQCFGISTFMAGQVAADLTYATGHLDDAVDLKSYAPIGPGSSRGLNYLLDRKPFAMWEQGKFNDQLKDVNSFISSTLDIYDLTLHDVQNVMCEFSKYTRTMLNEGVPKTTYRPETEF